MKRVENRFASTYSIFLACEGEKSEPYFLNDLISLAKKKFPIDYTFDIWPAIKQKSKDGNPPIATKDIKSGRKANNRKAIDPPVEKPSNTSKENPGGNPKKWVELAEKRLGYFDEVAVIFDKDGHPTLSEAFDTVKKLQKKGKNIRIYFSSRSFEYYLLQHFEFKYRTFHKTECGEKVSIGNGKTTTKYYNCSYPLTEIKTKPNTAKECRGLTCINGYARSAGYWQKSKNDKTFNLAVNIWRGICNAETVRRMAMAENPNKEPYELNPYLDFQYLLIRLLGYTIMTDKKNPVSHDIGNKNLQTIELNGTTLQITNATPLPMRLPEGWLTVYEVPEVVTKESDFGIPDYLTETEQTRFNESKLKRDVIEQASALTINPGATYSYPLPSSLFTPKAGHPNSRFAELTLSSHRRLLLP